jgi:hypothetical protein
VIFPKENKIFFGGWRPCGMVFKTIIVKNEEIILNTYKKTKE